MSTRPAHLENFFKKDKQSCCSAPAHLENFFLLKKLK
jgi:hypothetical protein